MLYKKYHPLTARTTLDLLRRLIDCFHARSTSNSDTRLNDDSVLLEFHSDRIDKRRTGGILKNERLTITFSPHLHAQYRASTQHRHYAIRSASVWLRLRHHNCKYNMSGGLKPTLTLQWTDPFRQRSASVHWPRQATICKDTNALKCISVLRLRESSNIVCVGNMSDYVFL